MNSTPAIRSLVRTGARRAAGILLALLLAGSLPAASIPLAEPVVEIVTSPESFQRFVAPWAGALKNPPAGTDERMILGMRVHLALNRRGAAEADAAVAALRRLASPGEERAFTGIVTEAQIAAWAPGTTFAREIEARLRALPRTPAMAALLQRQREKLAATTREALLAEAERLGRQLAGQHRCEWAEADQIVRLHHRLTAIVPLRDDLVAALEVAIRERTPR